MNLPALVKEIEAGIAALPLRNTPALRRLRREYSVRLKNAPPEDIVEAAMALLAHGRVPRFVADELIASRLDAVRILTLEHVELLGAGMASWGDVDSFACFVAGCAWREGRIEDSEVARWARSSDRWWRRAALVGTVPLNVKSRGGGGEAGRTLRICELLIHDRDEMVVKALSWALRALASRDPEAVREFAAQFQAELPALVRREVRHKLETGKKQHSRTAPDAAV